MAIKGLIRDVTSVTRVIKRRERAHDNASTEPNTFDNIGEVARALHPGKISLSISDIRKELDYTIIKLTGDKIPYFRPGQYLSLEFKYENYLTTRPYTLISSPKHALRNDKYVEIAIKNVGNTSKYLCESLKVGDSLNAEIALGNFTYEPLRDSKNVYAIAEDINTSFIRSYALSIIDGVIDCNLTILKLKNNELIDSFIPEYERINVIEIDSINDIKNHLSNDNSYFISGSSKFTHGVANLLSENGIQNRRIRKDYYDSIISDDVKNDNSIYEIEVLRGIESTIIKANANETIAVALEKNNIRIHTACRNGICGACRIKLIDGEVYIPSDNENRRKMDIEYGYVYACHTYPKGNLKIKISIN